VDEDKSRRLVLIPTNHDFVQSAVWTSNGRIVTGGETGTIQIHDLGAILPNGAQHAADDEAGAVGGGGALGAGGGGAAGASGGGAGYVALEGHTMAVMCMCASARGQLVSGSVDHTLRVWDLATAKPISTIQAHSRSVHCVCTHELDAGAPHGGGAELIFSGSRDHTIRVRAAACLHRGSAAHRCAQSPPEPRSVLTRCACVAHARGFACPLGVRALARPPRYRAGMGLADK
jgi:WD40 repeat protein